MVCIEFRFMNYIMDMTYGTAAEKKEAVYKFRRLRTHLGLEKHEFSAFILINIKDAIAGETLTRWVHFVETEI